MRVSRIGRPRTHQITRSGLRRAIAIGGAGGIVALSAFSYAGLASAAANVSQDDSRAPAINGNITGGGHDACPASEPVLVDGGTTTTTQNGITVTVDTLSSSQPNPFPANGWTTLPQGTQVLSVDLPAGQQLTGDIYVKGGNGYNDYPGSALTSLIPPVNNGGNIAGLSHFLICGEVTPLTGSISVEKVVTGSGPGSDGTFSVEVDCGAGHDTTLTLSDGDIKTIDDIPDGSSCTVTETDSGGSTSQTYSVNSGSSSSTPPTFDVNAGDSDKVVVTNDYAPGSLKVTKHVSGTLPDGVTTFPITVNCDGDVTHLSLGDGDSQTISAVRGGADCTVTETNSHGAVVSYQVDAGSSSSSPADVTIKNDTETDVDVTNTFSPPPPEVGSVTVSKTVTGTPPDGLGAFDFTVDCGGVITPLSIAAGDSQSVDNIAAGSECTVTEDDSQGANSTTYSVDGGQAGDSADFEIAADHETTVDVVNDYQPVETPGTLTVNKVVDGTGTGSDGPFTVTADCGQDGRFTFDGLVNGSSQSHDVPAGASCTVTETDSNGATVVAYQVNSGSPSETAPQIGITSDETTTVTVTNVFVTVSPPRTGNLHITKAVNRKNARYGQDLTYTLHVSATGQITQHNVKVADVVPAKTTFVSAGCAAPCSAGGPTSGGVVTWDVGDLAAGASIDLTMVVNITTPADTTAQRQPETIRNVAVAASTEDPLVPSNKVHTRVTVVQGEQITRKHKSNSGSALPFTGFNAQQVALDALVLVGVGTALQLVARRRNARD